MDALPGGLSEMGTEDTEHNVIFVGDESHVDED